MVKQPHPAFQEHGVQGAQHGRDGRHAMIRQKREQLKRCEKSLQKRNAHHLRLDLPKHWSYQTREIWHCLITLAQLSAPVD